MAGVNQLERDLIRMRHREGIELAEKEGKFKGQLKKYHKNHAGMNYTVKLYKEGGTTWSEEIHQPILERIKLGTIVAAICGATEGLANMGYLDTRKHTSNNLEYTKMVCPNYKGEKFYEMRPAVSAANLVTASGIVPLEFAMEVLKKLDVFSPDTLHSWYNLNKTHKPEYFFQLMNSINR